MIKNINILSLVLLLLLIFTSCEEYSKSKNEESKEYAESSILKITEDKHQLEVEFYDALSAFENEDYYLSGLRLEKGIEYLQDIVIEVDEETKREIYAHIDSLLVLAKKLKNEENVDSIELKKVLGQIIHTVTRSQTPHSIRHNRR